VAAASQLEATHYHETKHSDSSGLWVDKNNDGKVCVSHQSIAKSVTKF